ncbi:MAG: ISAzo13 family transposase [Solirubrobacterales bacterium]|nr:ISAzo13 family transposase [Solirubrobacterales bacterium]
MAERWRLFGPECDERRRRLWAASEAKAHGPGGVALLARVTELSEETVRRGMVELEAGERLEPGQVRRSGGGRRAVVQGDPTVVGDLDRLIDPATRGDPESPLRWTSKSLGKLRDALVGMGHEISERTLGKLLKSQGFRLQANQKTREGSQHPDRDAQFEHINSTVKAALADGQPVISIDCKKKELLGDYKNGGREWEPTGRPVEVQGHDFPTGVPKAVPYGVYDLAHNEGYVSVGVSTETAQFSVASIRAWWEHLGAARFPEAKRLTITADCGGGNSPRVHLWKVELQRLADETGLELELCHFPPGTSKWNKVEHRLFSFISLNWRGRPLTSYETIIDLISSTTTSTGLKVYARLDPTVYTKVNVSKEQIAAVKITGHEWHPEWNYRISPSTRSP